MKPNGLSSLGDWPRLIRGWWSKKGTNNEVSRGLGAASGGVNELQAASSSSFIGSQAKHAKSLLQHHVIDPEHRIECVG